MAGVVQLTARGGAVLFKEQGRFLHKSQQGGSVMGAADSIPGKALSCQHQPSNCSNQGNTMEYQTPVKNLLDKTQLHPDKAFLHQPVNRQWQIFSWADVEQQARCIAAGLKAQGYESGSRIGILSKNCAQWFVADLAIIMAGMISVPIFAAAGRKTIKYIVEHSDIKAIFIGKLDNIQDADKAIEDKILRIVFPYLTVPAQERWDDWLSTYPPLAQIHMPELDEIYTIVYTSGSTGTPKGVIISHKNMASTVLYTAKALEMSTNDRIMSYLPLAHITERSVVENVAFFVGGQVFFVEAIDTFIQDLHHAKPTAFISVPRLWLKFKSNILERIPQQKLDLLLNIPLVNKLVAYKIRKALGLHHANRFGSGTAPISVSVLEWYQCLGICISEGWGMTESSGLSCGNSPFDKALIGTIGWPLQCLEMKLSSDSEILIRGDAVFSEYYLDTVTSAAAFKNGWFHTGDLGQVDNDGVYKVVGRTKEQFKTSKGNYVVPVPIESLMGENHHIEQVCVMGSRLKQPVALVVLVDNCNRGNVALQQDLENSLQTINSRIEHHQKLDYILVCNEPWTVENGLLTPTLKLKRNVLEARYQPLLTQELSGAVLWETDFMKLA